MELSDFFRPLARTARVRKTFSIFLDKMNLPCTSWSSKIAGAILIFKFDGEVNHRFQFHGLEGQKLAMYSR
jgi:hypothetical protein